MAKRTFNKTTNMTSMCSGKKTMKIFETIFLYPEQYNVTDLAMEIGGSLAFVSDTLARAKKIGLTKSVRKYNNAAKFYSLTDDFAQVFKELLKFEDRK